MDKSSRGVNRKEIPISMSNRSFFNDDFLIMKERFDDEMKRMDEEITKFSKNLTILHGMQSSRCNLLPAQSQNPKLTDTNERDFLNNSPLVVGKGEEKKLKLQFDLSVFYPSEVKVTIEEDLLIVEAVHVNETPGVTVRREYAREVQLPKNLDIDSISCKMTSDGILTVEAPLSSAMIAEERRVIDAKEQDERSDAKDSPDCEA